MKYNGRSFWLSALLIALTALSFSLGCSEEPDNSGLPGDADTDGDTDGDADGDSDSDSDTDADGDSPVHPDDLCDAGKCSYLWVANTSESTLSKVNTFTRKEVARYRTCPGTGPLDCDPSRTSVNLHGDVVVTNRYPQPDPEGYPGVVVSPDTIEKSSVTKFAADRKDCVDRNGDGYITTSTGPEDVLGWEEDECMLWNSDLGLIGGKSPRARATAWDGSEDKATGAGGRVIIGTCLAETNEEWDINTNVLLLLNGDTGAIDDQINVPNTECFYGGAMDSSGHFWIMDGYGFPHNENLQGLIKVDLGTKQASFFPEACGYGISVDADGNVWTGGKDDASADPPNISSCVQKFDSNTETAQVTSLFTGGVFLRGIAVGSGVSAGYVWAAERKGQLYKIKQDDLTSVTIIDTPAYNAGSICASYEDCPNNLVGVAIDYEGYVWSVSTVDETAYRFDPVSGTFESVVIGDSPYTYSDMTGMQLQQVISID